MVVDTINGIDKIMDNTQGAREDQDKSTKVSQMDVVPEKTQVTTMESSVELLNV